MEKTRKERIKAVSNKRTTEQFNQTHLVYKRGTAVLSTTLLVGLLAFPSFSVSATANDLANSSNAKLESAKEVVEETTNEVEEVATEEQEVQVLSGDALIEKEQKISDLKLLLSETQIEELNFEELTIDEIEELLIEALDVANKGSIESDDSSKVNDPPSTITVEKESLDIIAEDTLAAEKAATEQAVAEQTATEKATAEQVTAEQAATEKAAADKLAAEKAATAKAA
ncbi:MAG: hypothetical protein RR649_05940, partial [Carnobacterium sp.]